MILRALCATAGLSRMASKRERVEAVKKAMETQATYANILGKRDK